MHNPIWDYSVKLQYCYFQMSGPFFRSVPWCFVVVTDKTHTFPKLTTFIRLVFDTFGRMPTIAEKRRLIWCTRRTGAFWDFSFCCTFIHLYCLCLVIVVPAKENLVNHVCLYLCFFLSMSCLELHDAPLEHFPFAIHCLHRPVIPSLFLLLSSAFLLMGTPLAVLSFRASKFRSCVT